MGYNTTVVVLNDSLDHIRKDRDFGRKLAEKVSSAILPPEYRNHLDVSAGPAVNAAEVIETHHVDGYAVVAVGGNTGITLGTVYPYGEGDLNYRILKTLADQMGYNLHRKPKRSR